MLFVGNFESEFLHFFIADCQNVSVHIQKSTGNRQGCPLVPVDKNVILGKRFKIHRGFFPYPRESLLAKNSSLGPMRQRNKKTDISDSVSAAGLLNDP